MSRWYSDRISRSIAGHSQWKQDEANPDAMCVQVVLLTLLMRFLATWFARHEEEASKVSERFFVSPTSFQKVRTSCSVCHQSCDGKFVKYFCAISLFNAAE